MMGLFAFKKNCCLKILFLIFVLLNSTRGDDFNYLKYASNVFTPGELKPIRTINRLPDSEEKQIKKVLNDSKLNEVIIEGDILINLVNSSNPIRTKRKIINERTRRNQPTRWPNNIIPYEYDPMFSYEMRSLVKQAMDHWHKYTCIRFEPYNPVKHNIHRNRLYFQPSNICGSFIGYVIESYTKVSKSVVFLGKDCLLGNIIHELGHTIGFRHEHSRIDRDQHIFINFNKISQSYKPQYYMMDDSQPGYYNVPYDLYSIMHYGSSGNIITALDPNRKFLLGQRDTLSFLDIQLTNLAYKCSEKCPPNKVCLNSGFLDQYCNCFCPQGITGVYCENLIQNSYPSESVINVYSTDGLDCTFFNNNFCKWFNEKTRATQDWIFNKPSLNGFTETQDFFRSHSNKFQTGPQNGDRFGNRNGIYIYMNSLRKTIPGSNAILSSPQIKANVQTRFCLKFWFNMYQGIDSIPGYPLKIGNLSVNIRYSNGKQKIVWFKDGNQGANWLLANVDLLIEPPMSSIFFEGRFKENNYGDICLDDIELKKGPCSTNFPIQGILSEWSQWTGCSARCGQGVQTRRRECIKKSKNQVCNNGKEETRKCLNNICPTTPYFSEWSQWSRCTKGCNSYRYRLRRCLNNRFTKCSGETVQYSVCSKCKSKRNILEKVIDKDSKNDDVKNEKFGNTADTEVLSEWSEWSSCYSKKSICDNGIQLRTKSCLSNLCKNIPKEVRECEKKRTLDLDFYCFNQYSKLNLIFECKYGLKNKYKNELITPFYKCKNTQMENDNSDSLVNVISIISEKTLGSFVIDSNRIEESHIIRLFVNSTLIKSPNPRQLTVEVHFGFQKEFKPLINFFFIDDKNNFSKLDDFSINEYPEQNLISYLIDITVNENIQNISVLIETVINQDEYEIADEKREVLLFKGVFITDNTNYANKTIIEENKSENELINNSTMPLIELISVNETYTVMDTNSFAENQTDLSFDNLPTFDVINSNCGGLVDLSNTGRITISSPNYPFQYPTNLRCNYLIKSPVGTKISIKALDLDLEQSRMNLCVDGLEFRYYHLGQPGPVFCGTINSVNQLFLKSFSNFFMIIFRSDWGQTKYRRGFRIEASYVYY